MSNLIIGQNSFIAQNLKKHPDSKNWRFISHSEAFSDDIWKTPYNAVLNLAADPKVKRGGLCDFDLKVGLKAQENGAHFIAMSSRTVYGFLEEGHSIFDEQHEWLPNCSPYGVSKRQMERSLQDNLDLTKLTILRPSNIFGFEYNAKSPRPSFFGQMLHSLKEKGVIYFDMAGQTKRDFIHIDHFCGMLAKVISAPKSNIYNMGSGIGLHCSDIAKAVIESYGSGKLDIIPNTKIKDSFHLDISKFCEHYEFNAPKESNILEKCSEIGKKLRDL